MTDREYRDLLGEVRALRLEVELLRPTADRDDADDLALIRSVVRDRDFTARELVDHATVLDTTEALALRRVLARRQALSGRRAGKWLSTLEGRALAGLSLRVIDEVAEGLVWRCVGLVSQTDAQTHVAPFRTNQADAKVEA